MGLRRLVLDVWSAGNFKQGHLDGAGEARSLAPTWVPDEARRRLRWYGLIYAYRTSNASAYLSQASDEDKANRREYGDFDLITERIVGGLLGDDIEVVVEDANVDLPDSPVLPPQPDEVGEGATDIDRLLFDARTEVWDRQAREAIEAWSAAHAAMPAARERQEWLRDWFDVEQVKAKVYESERKHTVPLGDGVLTVALDRQRGRPVVRLYDPGHYHPVIDVQSSDYPTKVHIAWEFEEERPDRSIQRYVERLTWELVDGDPVAYAWNDGPSLTHCLFTDAYWKIDDLGDRKVDDFSRANATYRENLEGLPIDALDLGLDFLPIIHVPNTPSSVEHFGTSALARVLQMFDDIADADTDLHAAGKFAAGPMLAGNRAAGTQARSDVPGLPPPPLPEITIAPGTWVNLGEGGRLDVVDLAGSLAPLQQMIEFLLDRLSVNAQVSAEILGRVSASEVPSGVALALSFGPFEQLVNVMRMVREHKYSLLLKFVQRVAIAGGYLQAPVADARLAFGSYLPSDQAAVVDMAVKLLGVHGLSKRSLLAALQDSGWDLGDLADELARIESEDFAAAVELADATGDADAVRARLGLGGDGPDLPEAPPEIVLPPLPPNQPRPPNQA